MVKLKDLEKYDTLLDVQKSDKSDNEYEIRWSKQHGYFCTCPGWQSSKKKPKVCKHIKRFKFMDQLEKIYPGFDREIAIKLAKETWT